MLVDIVALESDDVAYALAEEIARCNINKLVIGASTPPGQFSRYFPNKLDYCIRQ